MAHVINVAAGGDVVLRLRNGAGFRASSDILKTTSHVLTAMLSPEGAPPNQVPPVLQLDENDGAAMLGLLSTLHRRIDLYDARQPKRAADILALANVSTKYGCNGAMHEFAGQILSTCEDDDIESVHLLLIAAFQFDHAVQFRTLGSTIILQGTGNDASGPFGQLDDIFAALSKQRSQIYSGLKRAIDNTICAAVQDIHKLQGAAPEPPDCTAACSAGDLAIVQFMDYLHKHHLFREVSIQRRSLIEHTLSLEDYEWQAPNNARSCRRLDPNRCIAVHGGWAHWVKGKFQVFSRNIAGFAVGPCLFCYRAGSITLGRCPHDIA